MKLFKRLLLSSFIGFSASGCRADRGDSAGTEGEAEIQASSRRNATIYHLRPPFSWARNQAMKAGLGMGAAMDGLYRYDALSAVGG